MFSQPEAERGQLAYLLEVEPALDPGHPVIPPGLLAGSPCGLARRRVTGLAPRPRVGWCSFRGVS